MHQRREDRRQLLLDTEFEDGEVKSWHYNESLVSIDAGTGVATLEPGGVLSQVIQVDPSDTSLIGVLALSAASPTTKTGALRLQVTWLPEGGWTGTDKDGRSMVCTESTSVSPSEVKPILFEGIFIQPNEAMTLNLALCNDGPVPLQISLPRYQTLRYAAAGR